MVIILAAERQNNIIYKIRRYKMKNFKLQDIRKKATRLAYEREVMDCSHDVIIEFSECNNLPMPDLNNINQVADFMLLHVFNNECNYPNNKKLTPNIYQRVENWVMDRMTFGCYHYDICEWLVSEGLVSDGFIPQNNDLLPRMQLAGARHFNYIARTILDNASKDVFYKMV